MRLFVATSNPGKLLDFASAARTHSLAQRVEIEPLPGLDSVAPPPENEPTFAGNANSKALYYAQQAAWRTPELQGGLVLADDSGLEVDALNGAPGVRSARYADDLGYELHRGACTDYRNNSALLQQLRLTSRSMERTARYRCALAVAGIGEPCSIVATADGVLEGEILATPRGTAGFGYDSLFLVAEAGLTMAELPMKQRLELSHRGRALRKLLGHWPGSTERHYQ